MKKLCKGLCVLTLIVLIVGCGKKTNPGLDFKNDYESINGKATSSTSERTFREVTIDDKNPFEHVSQDEVVKMIENGETFYLYVGDKMCPWCRSVIEMASKVAIDKKVSKIYYINIWDDEHNEIFRDKYELTEDGKLNQTVEGTKAYHTLLEKFDSVLSDYTLTDADGNKVETGEKRIYAPNFFYIKKGEVKEMIEGISEKQTDAYGELTEEILEDEKTAFEDFFDLDNSCSLEEAC